MKTKYRVLTLGLKYADFDRQRELFALQANKDIEIIGELDYAPEDEEIFYCRKSIREVLELSFDIIMVCTGSIDDAKKRWKELSILDSSSNVSPKIPEEILQKMVTVEDFAEPYHIETEKQQIRILHELVEATNEEISDREWMKERLYRYGYFPFFKLVKKPQDGVHYSTYGIMQVPDEFLDYCMYISAVKCKNAIEIGVFKGGSSYIMAALLYRNNPNMKYYMVDVVDRLIHFDEVKNMIPSLEKRIPHTSDDFAGETYDFCFIDGDHSYQGMMTDWNNLGQHAGITVFHDIYAHEYDEYDGGTVRGWQEIRELTRDRAQMEFTRFPDKWMGIGVVETREHC